MWASITSFGNTYNAMVKKCGPRVKRLRFTSVAYLEQKGYTFIINRSHFSIVPNTFNLGYTFKRKQKQKKLYSSKNQNKSKNIFLKQNKKIPFNLM